MIERLLHRTPCCGTRLSHILGTITVSSLCWLSPTPSLAEQPEAGDRSTGISGTLTAGLGIGPDYAGSDDYALFPALAASLSYEGFVLETDGLGLRADLVPLDAVSFGPVLRVNPGRSDVEDDAVDRLPDVDAGMEFGIFLGIAGQSIATEGDRMALVFTAVQDVTEGHEGATVDIEGSWTLPLADRWQVTPFVGVSWADEAYMDAFYGVSASAAAASGLAAYDATEGFKSVTIGQTLTYAITENLSGSLTTSYQHLQNAAADSPVTKDRGSQHQFSVTPGLTWAF